MKRFLLGFIISLHLVSGYAQISLGPKAGIAISKFPDYFNANPVVGYKLGAEAQYLFFHQNIYLKSGVFFIKKGMSGMEVDIEGVEPGTAKQYMNVKMTYLNIPLSIGYSLTIKENIRIKADVGMYYGYGIKSSGYLILSDLSEGSYTPFDENYMSVPAYTGTIPAFNRKDHGISTEVSLAVYKFHIGISYDHGLATIHNHFPYQSGDYKPKNRSFSFTAGWMF